MPEAQLVCTVCGYNMVGYSPEHCPFCGASKEKFLTSEECSARYSVVETPVTDHVSRLNSTPRLGLEHTAYRIRTHNKTYMIDCPSCFDPDVTGMDTILFTHFHFLGSSNQYREHFSANVWINTADSRFELCKGFPFDRTFEEGFEVDGIEAYHLDGHTPGFTCYFFEDVFFLCDYVFKSMRFNPYGPRDRTIEGGHRIRGLIEGSRLSTVCAVDYVMDFNEWVQGFDRLLDTFTG
ncbi:MAG: hypothetical protein M8353_03340 [ANME-2 cluster archaeon]|nr:hypothetical protein [ANME-2 cluster archaeon]